MKRGFLNSSKAKQLIDNAVFTQQHPSKNRSHKVHLDFRDVATEPGLPDGYESPKLFSREVASSTLEYDPNAYIYTCVPAVNTECLVSGHVKRMIYDTSAFPVLPLPPTRGKAYRIGEAGAKGLGMFSTRLIRAGDLIIDERPMTFSPANNAGSFVNPKIPNSHYTLAQHKQVIQHETEKSRKLLFDRLPLEYQKAFMELANSHEHDGSGSIVGRIRTNGIECVGLRDKDTTGDLGRYTCVCKDISRINHSCCPNANYCWHTESFSVRVYAVRDIPANTEITIAYCEILRTASERAKYLLPYGITSCACSATCIDPALSKISDERRVRFNEGSLSLVPSIDSFTAPKPGEAEDRGSHTAVKWVQEMEEEGFQVTSEYRGAAYMLANMYAYLQDVEKALFYAKKLEGIHKAFEEKTPLFLTEEAVKSSLFYQLGKGRR
ncbi:SET domain-containing protein [Gymnopus androsaceus JB14]|uniref:SET domain-containing protein n=1 Tax=Gymnopus androsaceus JB14 TaxID=1447944 RepID=A0A6A4I5V3_9AGAR|nr:SET domain-containing protein [Gymnopus androsaceus JB14]